MTNEEIEDLNTFKHDLVKQARRLQWKVETLEKENEHLKAENDALRERLEGAVGKDSVANILKELFDSPCNFSPLGEEMCDYCHECIMDDVACWKKVIDKKCREA